MTVEEILFSMKKAGKPVKQARLYELLQQLKIKPVGHRQRPQQYPDDTPDRLLKYYGIA